MPRRPDEAMKASLKYIDLLRRSPPGRWIREVAWRWIVIVGVSAVATGLFAKVGEDVFNHESTSFDGAIRAWVISHQWRPLWLAFFGITSVGGVAPMLVLAFLVASWLWRRARRHLAAAFITAPAIAVGIGDAVKYTYHRVRPAGALQMHITTYAFPSGHSTGSAAVLVTLAYVLAREGVLRRRDALLIGMAGPLLIGVSRIYLDVHWATDVLAGWALGLTVACMSAAFYENARRKVDDRAPAPPEVPSP